MSFITELLRTTVVTNSLHHCTTKHSTVQGRQIPKGITHSLPSDYTTSDITPPQRVKGWNIRSHPLPGTAVIANLWSVNNDPDVYAGSDKFNPRRFLAPDGTYIQPDARHFVPFGAGERQYFHCGSESNRTYAHAAVCIAGRRACPGAALAHMELFLFIVSVLQKFEITAHDRESLSSKSYGDFVLRPAKYSMTLEEHWLQPISGAAR